MREADRGLGEPPRPAVSGWGSAGAQLPAARPVGPVAPEASEPSCGLSSSPGALPAASARTPAPATLSTPSPPAPAAAPAGESTSWRVGARATQPTTRSTGHGARVRPDPPPADSVSPGWSLPQPPRHSAPLPRGLWEDRRAPGTSWGSEPTVTCRPVSHPQAPGPRCGPAASRRPGFALGSSWGPPSASVPGAGFSVKNCFSFLFRSGRPRGGGTL